MVRVVRSIDVGYGYTKVVMEHRTKNRIECLRFPSYAPAAMSSDLSAGTTKRDTKIVDVDGVDYEVGINSRDALGNYYARVLDPEFTKTPNYLALVRGALSYINLPKISLLAVGLPVSLYQKRIKGLRERLVGIHPLADDKAVEIEHVWAVPQPLGGLFYYAHENARWDIAESQVNLVIDPGYFTVDWIVSIGPRINDARCGSFNGGVSEILSRLAKSIGPEIGAVVDRVEGIEDALINNRKANIFGTEVDLKDHMDGARIYMREALSAIKNSVGSGADINNIIAIGGGSTLFMSAIKEAFPKHKILTVDEPAFANVRGFQIAAESRVDDFYNKAAGL